MKAWEATDPTMTAGFLVGLIREEQVRPIVHHRIQGLPRLVCLNTNNELIFARVYPLSTVDVRARDKQETIGRIKFNVNDDREWNATIRLNRKKYAPFRLCTSCFCVVVDPPRHGVRVPGTCGSARFAL